MAEGTPTELDVVATRYQRVQDAESVLSKERAAFYDAVLDAREARHTQTAIGKRIGRSQPTIAGFQKKALAARQARENSP